VFVSQVYLHPRASIGTFSVISLVLKEKIEEYLWLMFVYIVGN
jgi:hypothetical protein